jgi:hypothetical protein
MIVAKTKIYVISYWLQNKPFYSFKMKLATMTRLETANLQVDLQLEAQMHVYNDLQTATSTTKV